jgi:hypothetical protein
MKKERREIISIGHDGYGIKFIILSYLANKYYYNNNN